VILLRTELGAPLGLALGDLRCHAAQGTTKA
jgi:hypothetical protein